MARWRVGMRWWLGGAFVLIAVLTATLLSAVSARQSSQALEANSEDLAVGKTVSAAFTVEKAVVAGNLDDAVTVIGGRRALAIFVFDPSGQPISPTTSLGIAWGSVPGRTTALAAALGGHRFVQTSDTTGATVTALPLRRTDAAGALVSYAPRPVEYGRSLAIFRRETVRAALWAVLAAAAVGLLAAGLVARRLRRIDEAATAIERGDFETELAPYFGDEVGSLAMTIDRMRRRLRVSFDQLRAERDRLGRLLEQLHEGVVAVDPNLVVQFANATAARLTGRPAPTVGLPLPEVWPATSLRELAGGLFRRDAAIAESRLETGDGRAISLVGVPAGESELAVIVLTDVTEQERRERAEREFVANASHELQTPVSAIISAVEALQSGAKNSSVDRDVFLALIERQATRLARLIRSLLLLARAQTQQGDLQLEPVELRPIIERVAASAEPPPHIAIEVACPAGLTALAQRDVAEQVLSNLLGNALRHSTDGCVVLRAMSVEPYVLLEVIDNGPGIATDAQQRMFDRFYSGESGGRDGFGLGLAIVREAVRALGGTIDIDSELGCGTTVRVTLAESRQ